MNAVARLMIGSCGAGVAAMFLLAGEAAAAPPIGAEAMRLDRLSVLRPTVRAYQASSHDPTGGNNDTGHFLDTRGEQRVLLDVVGAGCIYRVWMTGIDEAGILRIYFDAEPAPRVEMPLGTFFGGQAAPFVTPLVGGPAHSSGGYICYVPMPFSRGCRITTTGVGHYYNVTYHRYADAEGVVTFTGEEDLSAIIAAWNDAGLDPKADSGTHVIDGRANVGPGQSLTLAQLDGAGTIAGIEIALPGMSAPHRPGRVTHDGRAHAGSSAFSVAVDAGNAGVRLTRTLDYGVADQHAMVLVDGELVGPWVTAGRSDERWLESAFEIPEAYSAGKSSLAMRIENAGPAAWTEFLYRVDSMVNGMPSRRDVVDVGDTASESAHGYEVQDMTWQGSHDYHYADAGVVADHGRGMVGFVAFDVAVDPANAGVRLTRRMAHDVGYQRGRVYVDGTLAGEWYERGRMWGYWRNSAFDLGPALTAGKSTIHLRIEFVSSDEDWNEFYYWVDSLVESEYVQTDTLDVGDVADEVGHNYVISGQTWAGNATLAYDIPPDPVFRDILCEARLRATWDEAAAAQVDVPLGSLFGSQLGPKRIGGLPTGIDGERMYCWFPMPFGQAATLELVNDSPHALSDVAYRVRYTPSAAVCPMNGVGYFHARSRMESPCTPGRDYGLLDETGCGHLVGIIETRNHPYLYCLEGDERVYIDGSLAPQLYGTGTEDFYNGGWYFRKGRFSLPTHGNPTIELAGNYTTDMYRFFIGDLLPFAGALRAGIEHGGTNDTTDTIAWSAALYYRSAVELLEVTDVLDVGDAASEAAHGYVATGVAWTGELAATYEGDDDDVEVVDSGRHFAADGGSGAQFTLAIAPYNDGVLLRRRMDYDTADQAAEVLVGGVGAGVWHDAGRNGTHRFRDSEFLLPASSTRGRDALDVGVRNVSASAVWTEYRYWALTLRPAAGVPGDTDCDGRVDFDDIDPFVLALAGQAAYEAEWPACNYRNADCDGDGRVDFDDIDPFVELLAGGW